jgi:cytochrome P450
MDLAIGWLGPARVVAVCNASPNRATMLVMTPRAPRPPGLPVLGHVAAIGDPLTAFESFARDYGPMVELQFFNKDYVVISSATGAHHVLVDHWERYPKSRSYDALRLFLGNGLVTSEGTFWRRQRKLMQPAFHRQRLASFLGDMVEATDTMLVEWERAADHSPDLDVHTAMTELTFRIVGRTLFSIDLGGEANEMGKAVELAQHAANDYATSLVRFPLHWPTPLNRRVKKARAAHDAVAYKILEERKRDAAPRNDLLAMLLEARDEETGEGMTDEQVRDEMVTLIAAGHETTASTLAWTFYHLGKRPDVARGVVREVREVLGDRAPTLADLPQLDYTRRVIEEAMRLHPAVTGVERVANEDDVIDGYHVPKGALIAVMMWTLHRNPEYFPNPNHFDPDRFLPEAVARRPKHAYLPFGAGPRICIGNSFAMMEAQVLLARISQRFRLLLDPNHPIFAESLVTMRPKHGIKVRLERV